MISYELAKKLKDAGFPQKLNLLRSADDVYYIEHKRDVALLFQRDDLGRHRTFDLSLLGYPETEPDYWEQGKWRASSIFSKEYLESEEGKSHTVYFPILSELIEACGKDFDSLGMRTEPKVGYSEGYKKWGASCSSYWEGIFERGKTQGSTPEEAVANLYIALHKHD